MAAPYGFEPQLPESKAGVLPLDDGAKGKGISALLVRSYPPHGRVSDHETGAEGRNRTTYAHVFSVALYH
jgi:hypothetical protein